MAIMSEQEWKDGTSVWNKPRSNELKRVDTALKNYHLQGKKIHLIGLIDAALTNWIVVKNKKYLNNGNWRKSSRNKNGKVEALINQLHTEMRNQTCNSWIVSGLEKNQAAPKQIIASGHTVGYDIEGHWTSYSLQNKGNSCGPTCVAIVINLALHYTNQPVVSEVITRDIISLAEQGRLHQGSGVAQAAAAMHDWDNIGSDPKPLIEILKKYLLKAAGINVRGACMPRPQMLLELKKVTPRKPAILGWWWQNNGGHWTVCVGPTNNGKELTILDPCFGKQKIQINPINFIFNGDPDNYICYSPVDEQGNVVDNGHLRTDDQNDIAVILTH
jgi:hypothetical protein